MKNNRQGGILAKLARLVRDPRGVSAVEFAVILPIMVTLFVAGSEITQAITIKRKATQVVRTVADLTSQDSSITNAEMLTIFGAATSVLAPYSPTNGQGNTLLKIIVSSVNIDAQGTAKVGWSDSSPAGYAHTPNTTITLPAGLNVASTSLIWAEVSYDYIPPVGYGLLINGTITLTDKIYLRPRMAATIARVP
jgi:Flp pilus assembly protein TadG